MMKKKNNFNYLAVERLSFLGCICIKQITFDENRLSRVIIGSKLNRASNNCYLIIRTAESKIRFRVDDENKIFSELSNREEEAKATFSA